MTGIQKRVLLVDDDEGVVEPLRLALQEHGYDVVVANDGCEALMRAERDAPDLILLDVVMPKRSGFAVLDRLSRGQVHSPRIIMMTGNTEPHHREYALSHGVDGFINKPFDLPDLLNQVDLMLADGESLQNPGLRIDEPRA